MKIFLGKKKIKNNHNDDNSIRILITGVTGMLGRSVYRKLIDLSSKENHNLYKVLGTGYSRAKDSQHIKKLDLRKKSQVTKVFQSFQPQFVIHCAAERRPDVALKNPKATYDLNVKSTHHLATLCKNHGCVLIYMSTEYVFDGGVHTKCYAPYKVDDEAHPLNNYGVSKFDGEEKIRSIFSSSSNARTATATASSQTFVPKPIIIRVPVLYATDCESLDESASLVVAKGLKKDSLSNPKTKSVDHWGIRYPTLVDDVAEFFPIIIEKAMKEKNNNNNKEEEASGMKQDNEPTTTTYHISSHEKYTKYEMIQLMGSILDMDTTHLVPNPDPPEGAPRPQDSHLDCSTTWEALGIVDPEKHFTPLKEGLTKALQSFASELKS